MTRTHKVCVSVARSLLLFLCSVSAGCISVLEAAGFSFLSDGLWRQVSCKVGLHLEVRKECVVSPGLTGTLILHKRNLRLREENDYWFVISLSCWLYGAGLEHTCIEYTKEIAGYDREMTVQFFFLSRSFHGTTWGSMYFIQKSLEISVIGVLKRNLFINGVDLLHGISFNFLWGLPMCHTVALALSHAPTTSSFCLLTVRKKIQRPNPFP